MWRAAGVAVVVGGGIWVYRRLGWLRLETPMADLRRQAFKDLRPAYRQTHPAHWWKLRRRKPRKVA